MWDEEKNPIIHTIVRIKDRESEVYATYFTDGQGRLRIYNLKHGCHDLKITKSLYTTGKYAACIDESRVITITLKIDEDEYFLKPFKVVWERNY